MSTCENGDLNQNDCTSGCSDTVDAEQDHYNDQEEAEHFSRVVATFYQYEKHALKDLDLRREAFLRLPPKQRLYLAAYERHLEDVRRCIRINQRFLSNIVSHVGQIFENSKRRSEHMLHTQAISEFNLDKLRSTLRQFVRDWSDEGVEERRSCYAPLLQDLQKLLPNPAGVSVLVPGAGLGRLAYDISRLGYSCEGNEVSLFMLFGSNFMLNHCSQPDSFVVHPWIHQWANNLSYADQVRAVSVPDFAAASTSTTTADTGAAAPGDFAMSAGDFTDVYSRSEWRCSFDAVVTVFFLDTARDVMRYVDVVRHVLKPGGYWINLGPLLYHYPDDRQAEVLQLPYEDIRRIIQEEFHFDFLEETTGVRTTYAQNSRSMLKYHYDCVKFICKKSLDVE